MNRLFSPGFLSVSLWCFFSVLPGLPHLPTCHADDSPTGLQNSVKVTGPTRLDWEFVASGFKPAERALGAYDSSKQQFQLYVPKTYDAKKTWPLIVFVSPGDAPMGWRYWQQVCTEQGILFCAAHGAGNNCPPGKRIRIILDMFDQVRRTFSIDPQRTYISGFSGGGRMACTIGFHLPEHFAGVLPIGGTNPLPRLDYLRHRLADRQSVALVTGEKDFNRVEHDQFLGPLLQELGIRSRVWVVPGLGHAVPEAKVLDEVVRWLDEDQKRRRDDARDRPDFAALASEDAAAGRAAQLLKAAREELKQDNRVWRGVTLLQGVVARFGKTDAGREAAKLLEEIKNDPRKLNLAGEQGGKDERRYLQAQARAFERRGDRATALQLWKVLAEEHPAAPEGKKAAEEIRRLTGQLGSEPFLGLGLKGQTNLIDAILPGGPADRAGLRKGDRLRSVHGVRIGAPADLRAAMSKLKPGAKIAVQVDRDDKTLTFMLEVGTRPME